MNLFFLDKDLTKCAQYHVDAHVGKIILEASQVLCTAFHLQNIEAPYKPSHVNHPTSKWVRQTRANLDWTIQYATALAEENHYRYGKWHKSFDVVRWAKDRANLLDFSDSGITPFALAMPEQYKTNCPVESYRNYYREDKKHLHSWKNRPIPAWL